MYVTRPLSLYKNSFAPSSSSHLSAPPPEGPNSGYLVIQDEDSLAPCCSGLCKRDTIDDLPLPSNKVLEVGYDSDDGNVFAIPVINQPLSASRYYLIKAHFKHKGEAFVCSKEDEKGVGCCGSYIKDVKPRPLDPEDIYQQFEFYTSVTCSDNTTFAARSAAHYAYPPSFLRRSTQLNIRPSTITTKDFIPREATGLDFSLRARLPDFNFPLLQGTSAPVCVGKWYCPFMFLNDSKLKLKKQVKKSVYYEIRLEQFWERIFTCENSYNTGGNKVMVDVVVPTEVVCIDGKPAVCDARNVNDKVVWFRTIGGVGEALSVGLSKLVVDRMIWEQERFGWVTEKQVRVIKEEEYGGIGLWVRFGCYVLVERYVVKRMDGSLVMTYDFKHTQHINNKWE